MYCALHTIRRRVFCCSSGTILSFLNTAWVCAALTVSHLALKVLPEQLIRCPHLLRQTLQGFLLQLRRHPIKGFGNAAGNADKGVAVFSFTYDAASENQLRFVLSTLRR